MLCQVSGGAVVKMRESSFRERQTGAVAVGGREASNVLGEVRCCREREVVGG